MAESFDFQLNLTGNFASSLAPVNKGLGEADKKLNGARDASKDFEKALGSLSGKISGIDIKGFTDAFKGGGLAGVWTLGISEGVDILKSGFEIALGIAQKIGATFVDIGKSIIKSASAYEGLHTSTSVILGDKGAADLEKRVGGLAKYTAFDDDVLISALQPLLLGGYKPGKLLDDVLTAASDTALIGKNQSEKESILRDTLGVFEKIQSTGKVDPRALRGLLIKQDDYFRELGTMLGVSAEVAKKQATEGRVARDTLISVILDQVAKRQGGALGVGSIAGANLVETRLEKLKDLPEQYFKKISETKGYTAFSDFLGRLLEQLDPDGPAGQKIIASIGRITDSIFNALGKIDLGETIDSLTDSLTKASVAFREAWPTIETFGRVLGMAWEWGKKLWSVLVGIGDAMTYVAKLGQGLGGPLATLMGDGGVTRATDRETLQRLAFYEQYKKRLAETGHDAGVGFALGVEKSTGEAKQASSDLAMSTVEQVQSDTQTHSPSRVFEQLGGYVSQGFALGVQGGTDDVRSAARRAFADSTIGVASSSSVAGSSGGPSVVVSEGAIVIHLNASSGDAREQAQEAMEVVEVQLAKIFDRIGYSLGAAT